MISAALCRLGGLYVVGTLVPRDPTVILDLVLHLRAWVKRINDVDEGCVAEITLGPLATEACDPTDHSLHAHQGDLPAMLFDVKASPGAIPRA